MVDLGVVVSLSLSDMMRWLRGKERAFETPLVVTG